MLGIELDDLDVAQRAAAGDRPVRQLHPRPERLPADRDRGGPASKATRRHGADRCEHRGPAHRPRLPRRHRAHCANPVNARPATPLTADADTHRRQRRMAAGTYDDELLDAHFIAGDGRVNENIGLTAVHHVFHSEHNRLVEHTKDVVLAAAATATSRSSTSGCTVDVAAIPADLSTLVWDGERLFQAASFGTEMQYQHLVFEEFARKVQPNVDIFIAYDDHHRSVDRGRVRAHGLPLRPLDADRDGRPLRCRLQRRPHRPDRRPSSTRSSSPPAASRRTRRPAPSCAA